MDGGRVSGGLGGGIEDVSHAVQRLGVSGEPAPDPVFPGFVMVVEVAGIAGELKIERRFLLSYLVAGGLHQS